MIRVLDVETGGTEAGIQRTALLGTLLDTVTADTDTAVGVAGAGQFDAILVRLTAAISAADLVQSLRAAGVSAPILLLASLDQLREIVQALKAGADDYMTDPVDTGEVADRVFRLARDHQRRVQPTLRLGELTIDLERRTLHVNNRRMHLTGKEFQVLELLATRHGTTVSKGQILHHLYAGSYVPVMKIVDVFVSKLRKKLGTATVENYIKTVWGQGYILLASQCDHGDARVPFRSEHQSPAGSDVYPFRGVSAR